ncbi:MAG TPA: DUF2782 domain-containing protein [Gammaproteobacteria bacterium]|nr:DUF2782 domain-containing protein [Gammaproteobacteria bacterium]
MKLLFIPCLIACLFTGVALAQDSLIPPPPLPKEPQKSTDIPEPEVKIIHRKDRTVEEYRVNGVLRYIKIIPSYGPAYYMVDTNGDGTLDQRFDDLENPPINQWILLQW